MCKGMLTDLDRAAIEVVDLTKALVVADNRFLSAAVGRLDVALANYGCGFATDGVTLSINSQLVCLNFREKNEPPKHDYVHSILHCLFLHPFVGPGVDRRLWSLACDIAVERNVVFMCGERSGKRGEDIYDALRTIERDLGASITAEKIYKQLRSHHWDDKSEEWKALFSSDDHRPWYPESACSASTDGPDSAGKQDEGISQSKFKRFDGGSIDDRGNKNAYGVGRGDGQDDRARRWQVACDFAKAKEGWRRVAKSLAVDLKTYGRNRGSQLGGFVQDIEESARRRVSYDDFLRQFAVPGEVLKVSEDEFDYVFYTYGLSLYGNLPLIEPLEYREEKRVREFVIVLDTSASVCGSVVRRFVEATYDILKSTEAFHERVHVRIIQCDMAVQSDEVITRPQELKEWGNKMRLYGFGGTDFRPAFEYVDGLVESGAFENLGGLVYFTDGDGVYPDWMPVYRTAFAFCNDRYNASAVPPWAAQITLGDTDDVFGK